MREAMAASGGRQAPPGARPGGGRLAKPGLLTVDDAKALSVQRMAELFADHVNPGQLRWMRLLGMDRVKVERAAGMVLVDQDGRRILDFFGGFGALALGHNHPRIVAARRRFQDEQRHEVALAFVSQYAAALAYDLAACSPGDLDVVLLGTSGSEAVETAVKLAERAAGPRRATVAYAAGSFHGKTKGALSVTDGPLYRGDFALVGGTVRVPFGDLGALAAAFRADPSIGVVVLETVQGGAGIVAAPDEFWRGLRALCDRHGVLWVADEVQCGFGRTGRFYAFEYAGVVPDVVALAKSLGGGKAAVGAAVARRPVFLRAYGSPRSAMIQATSTFGGTGEACVTAIEALNVLYDEGLVDNAAAVGAELLARLRALRGRYPELVADVRGRGLMVGIEFRDLSATLPPVARRLVGVLDGRLKGALPAAVAALLLRDHAVLVAPTEYDRNVVRLEPPLTCTPAHVATLVDALDELLARGGPRLVADLARTRR